MADNKIKLDVYINYNGRCEEAFRFYQQHLHGKITGIIKHSEMTNPHLPVEWNEKIAHARIEIGSTVIMGADIPGAEPMRSAYLTLTFQNESDAENTYEILSTNGEVFMKLAKTPFANRFAMLRDAFGTNWMILQQVETNPD